MNQKGFINIVLLVLALVLASAVGYFTFVNIAQDQVQRSPKDEGPIITPNPTPTPTPTPTPKPRPKPSPVACTQDAKQCSDGSYVGRVGPNCEFAICPTPKGTQITMGEGQRESSFLLERVYADYVTGLNFWEYPIATGEGHNVTLRIGEMVSNGCTVTLTLIRIEGERAIFIKKEDYDKSCPICLAKDTLIDTPEGKITVQNLQKGMQVWTVNKQGSRVPAIIIETAQTPVPSTHTVVHLNLNDGRELFASPNHPTIDGRRLADLSSGDSYDGALVSNTKIIPYTKGYTYDLLPSGDTGFYFADGILLGSTLIHHLSSQ